MRNLAIVLTIYGNLDTMVVIPLRAVAEEGRHRTRLLHDSQLRLLLIEIDLQLPAVIDLIMILDPPHPPVTIVMIYDHLHLSPRCYLHHPLVDTLLSLMTREIHTRNIHQNTTDICHQHNLDRNSLLYRLDDIMNIYLILQKTTTDEITINMSRNDTLDHGARITAAKIGKKNTILVKGIGFLMPV